MHAFGKNTLLPSGILTHTHTHTIVCYNCAVKNFMQEALYNIARAYHHVCLITLAASYYEKVLAIRVKDYPIPKLPCVNPDIVGNQKPRYKPGYCDLRRETAYNLHLIYKKSGALDLARQVLKDHCTI